MALLALYGVAYATQPKAVAMPVPKAQKVAVASVTAVCPDPGDTDVGVVTPPGGQGPGATTLDAKGKTLATLDTPGNLWHEKIPAKSPPLVVTATGSMAAGLEAAQTREETAGAQRGLAGVRCAEPVASTWLIGPGPSAADVTLHLTNADVAPAVVEIMVYSGEGPVFGDTGGAVDDQAGREPHDRRQGPGALAAGDGRRGAHQLRAGRRRGPGGHGRRAKGVDWLPVSAAPATRVVVPGHPRRRRHARAARRRPAEADTVVEVKALTPDGTYALKGRELVEVPAGSVATLDLSSGDRRSALRAGAHLGRRRSWPG